MLFFNNRNIIVDRSNALIAIFCGDFILFVLFMITAWLGWMMPFFVLVTGSMRATWMMFRWAAVRMMLGCAARMMFWRTTWMMFWWAAIRMMLRWATAFMLFATIFIVRRCFLLLYMTITIAGRMRLMLSMFVLVLILILILVLVLWFVGTMPVFVTMFILSAARRWMMFIPNINNLPIQTNKSQIFIL